MHNGRHAGFTLIELLFTLAIAAILSAAALPSFARLGRHTRIDAADNAIVAALHYARSVAIHRGIPVLLCPSEDGRTCTTHSDWSDGWLIAVDRDRDGTPDAAAIRHRGALPRDTRATSSVGRRRVHYFPDGSSPGSNLSITVCHRGDTVHARKIIVANSGRVRQGTPSAKQARACAAS